MKNIEKVHSKHINATDTKPLSMLHYNMSLILGFTATNKTSFVL